MDHGSFGAVHLPTRCGSWILCGVCTRSHLAAALDPIRLVVHARPAHEDERKYGPRYDDRQAEGRDPGVEQGCEQLTEGVPKALGVAAATMADRYHHTAVARAELSMGQGWELSPLGGARPHRAGSQRLVGPPSRIIPSTAVLHALT